MSTATKQEIAVTLSRKRYTAQLRWFKYQVDNRIGLELIDAGNDAMFLGERIAMASVNLPEIPLPDGCIFIKTWSQNEGLLDQLVAAGVVSEPVGWVPAGHARAAMCRILAVYPA